MDSAGWQAGRVPRRSGLTRPPRDYVTSDGTGPDGPFEHDAPGTVCVAAAVATAMRTAIDARGWTNVEAAARIGIGRQALQSILAGRVLPDMHTLVQAEAALSTRLWPGPATGADLDSARTDADQG